MQHGKYRTAGPKSSGIGKGKHDTTPRHWLNGQVPNIYGCKSIRIEDNCEEER